jgi:ABC-2 type transport system ATP-binding protein
MVREPSDYFRLIIARLQGRKPELEFRCQIDTGPMEAPMLEARHLVKRFFGTAVVSDVSFEVRAGEVVGYLGPNGSGKSTTAKMLTGLLETSAGSVYWNGADIGRDPVAFRQRLGYVPEEPNLYTFQSAIEYLELVGRLRELPPPLLERKIGALLELFGLSHATNQDIGSYSKGMKQKVMIIAALLHDPDVLILDEPDSGLDVTATLVLRQLVIALARRGKAVLYSSHVLELVEKACDRVVVIHRGHVVANDTVEALQRLMSRASLEEVFSQLVLRVDPERTAADIADVVVDHA